MRTHTPEYVFDIAKELRRNQTEAEKILWEYLRKKKLNEYKIRRQHPIGRYIADFCCLKARIVIEIDGKIHDNVAVKEYDEIRQKEFESRGLKVLRFRNEDIFERLDGVIASIEKEIKDASW